VKFRNESIISFPRERVFRTYRDHLSEIVRYMDDISGVTVLAREEAGAVVKLHNEWASAKEIPSVAQGLIKPEHLRWDDHAVWDEGRKVCEFTIHTRVYRDKVHCRGSNTFLAEGDRTRVVLEGEFTVSLDGIPGVPWLLAKTITPQVERFIVALIQPNLEKTNVAVGRFLEAGG
jgi:hypothetical protein